MAPLGDFLSISVVIPGQEAVGMCSISFYYIVHGQEGVGVYLFTVMPGQEAVGFS